MILNKKENELLGQNLGLVKNGYPRIEKNPRILFMRIPGG